MTPNVLTLPATGRRVIRSQVERPLARVECMHGTWGLF